MLAPCYPDSNKAPQTRVITGIIGIVHIAVDDVDASARKAEQLGGKIISQPFDSPNVGRMAVVQDATGAAFSLFKGSQA